MKKSIMDEAAAYVSKVIERGEVLKTAINDAANFYSTNYAEYMELCDGLESIFRK